jgi:hypothetical protein
MPAIDGTNRERSDLKKLLGTFVIASVIIKASTGKINGSIQELRWGNVRPVIIAREKIKFLLVSIRITPYIFYWDLIHQSGEKGNLGYWLLHEILNN